MGSMAHGKGPGTGQLEKSKWAYISLPSPADSDICRTLHYVQAQRRHNHPLHSAMPIYSPLWPAMLPVQ